MKRVIALLVILSISVWGCSKNSPTSPGGGNGGGSGGGTQQPIPLAVGNWWAYGSVNGTATDTARISGEEHQNGINVYIITFSNHPEDTLKVYYQDNYLKVLEIHPGQHTISPMMENYLKLPLEVGSSWLVVDTTYTNQGITYTLIDSAKVLNTENVTVPAGTFNNTYKIQYTMKILVGGNQVSQFVSYDFIYPGVGSVKYVSPDGDVRVLYSYNVQ